MQDKVVLSLTVSALIVALGGFLAVLGRLDDLADDVAAVRASTAAPTGRPPGVVPEEGAAASAPDAASALKSRDALAKLDHLIEAVQGLDSDGYDYFMDLGQDLFDLKREVRQLKATLRQVVQNLGKAPGSYAGIGWGLAPKGAPLDGETVKAWREEAASYGISVEDGVVRVRGFLNLSPNVEMPIEYFITRYPQAGHETLVHLIGNKDVSDLSENPYVALKGLATALYKGLLAAGFRQGEPTHPDPTSEPRNPTWVLASGDTLYLGVRYELGGRKHVALATDWVIDPLAESVLPVDAFRFTGSARGEDPDTGEEILAAEMMGLLVSVWPNAAALAEVSLESSLRNDYRYNFTRIPKPEGDDPLYLELIFSKTPIEAEGDGALPIERPPPLGAAGGEGR